MQAPSRESEVSGVPAIFQDITEPSAGPASIFGPLPSLQQDLDAVATAVADFTFTSHQTPLVEPNVVSDQLTEFQTDTPLQRVTPEVDEIHCDFEDRRTRPQKPFGFALPWLDNDETGDYDPALEQQRPPKKRRLDGLARRQPPPYADESLQMDGSDDSAETPPSTLLVALKFGAMKANFMELLSQFELRDLSGPTGYKLRSGNRSNPYARHDAGATDEADDLIAKPFARGCWACAHLTGDGKPTCSLLHDERQWPCQTCGEDGTDCEMIVPPTRKKACETCKTRKDTCSYVFTRNHGASCVQCETAELKCVAGPVKEFIRGRISYDRDLQAESLSKKRKPKAKDPDDCVECVTIGRSCIYETENYGGPCELCKSTHQPCTIIDARPTQPTQPLTITNDLELSKDLEVPKDPEVPNDSEVPNNHELPNDPGLRGSSPSSSAPITEQEVAIDETLSNHQHVLSDGEPTDQLSQEQESDNELEQGPQQSPPQSSPQNLQRSPQRSPHPKGKLRKILTCFSHPFIFNCDNLGPASTQCSFCAAPLLSVLGFGKLAVQVIDYPTGYIEVTGGHRGAGVLSTALCSACTGRRSLILSCVKHDFRAIPDAIVPTAENERRASRELWEAEEGGIAPGLMARYCALCARLASYECEKQHGGFDGCGLRLCNTCAKILVRRFDGVLEGMLGTTGVDLICAKGLSVRADVELLKEDGSLMQFLRWQALGCGTI